MASYANLVGKLDYSAAIKDIKKANSLSASQSIVKQFMNDATRLGITDNDQSAVTRVLVAYADKYNLRNNSDFKKLVNTWDPASSTYVAANAFNASSRVSNDFATLQKLSNTSNGGGGSTGGRGTTNTNTTSSSARAAAEAYTAGGGGFSSGGGGSGSSGGGGSIGGDGGGSRGTTTNTTEIPTTNYGSGGGGGGTPYTPTIDTEAMFKPYLDKINELKDQVAELTKPRSNAEIAAFHDIDYNKQHILDEYNERTNQYYDEALKYWGQYMNEASNYDLDNIRRTQQGTWDQYANVAPTATQRGALAAEELANYISNNMAMNEADYAIGQTMNNLRSSWKAELENNPLAAEEQYNALGNALMNVGLNYNTADVKQYIDQIDAYSKMYAASRATDAMAASGAAAKYSGLAQAAANRAGGYSYNPNNFETLYKYYLAQTNNSAYNASSAMVHNAQNSQGYNKSSGGTTYKNSTNTNNVITNNNSSSSTTGQRWY